MKNHQIIASLAFLFPLLGCMASHASGSPLVTPLKAGWSDQELVLFTTGCVQAIVTPARRDYYARAAERGNTSPKPFPEQEITASVKPMCSCIGLRIAQNYALPELVQNQEAIGKPFIDEALGGGLCKPEGLLGAMIEQRNKK